MTRRNFFGLMAACALAPAVEPVATQVFLPTRQASAAILDALNAATFREIYPKVIEDQFFKGAPLKAYLRADTPLPMPEKAFRWAPQ